MLILGISAKFPSEMTAVADGVELEAAETASPLLTARVGVTSAVETEVVGDSSSTFTSAFPTSSFASGPTAESMTISVPDFSPSSFIATSLAGVTFGSVVMGSDTMDPAGSLVCRAGCDPLSDCSEGGGWVSHFTAGGLALTSIASGSKFIVISLESCRRCLRLFIDSKR